MVAVDTNVIVRLLTGDDPEQSERAQALFRRSQVFIPSTVLLETEWVLRYACGFDVATVCGAFQKLLGLSNVRVDNPQELALVIEWHSRGLDFANAVHLAASQFLDRFYSFDEKLLRRSFGLGDCAVAEP